jgi:hypothetical protein
MRLHTIRVTVLTPGQPRQLSDVSLILRDVTISPLPTNTTRVCVGNAGVRARDGEQNALTLMGGTRPDTFTPPYPTMDISLLWVDAVTANEGVVVSGWID